MKSLVLICLRYNGIQNSEIMELLENMLFPILAYLPGETQEKISHSITCEKCSVTVHGREL